MGDQWQVWELFPNPGGSVTLFCDFGTFYSVCGRTRARRTMKPFCLPGSDPAPSRARSCWDSPLPPVGCGCPWRSPPTPLRGTASTSSTWEGSLAIPTMFLNSPFVFCKRISSPTRVPHPSRHTPGSYSPAHLQHTLKILGNSNLTFVHHMDR